jgi:hypothetical protein
VKLEDFSKDELIAIIYRMGSNHLVKDVNNKAVRAGLNERERKISAELERMFAVDTETLEQLRELGSKNAGKLFKDIPDSELNLIVELQDKLGKAQKKQSELRKRLDDCRNRIDAIYKNAKCCDGIKEEK